jgi:hypothetical protein
MRRNAATTSDAPITRGGEAALLSRTTVNLRSRTWKWLVRPQVASADRLIVASACDGRYLDYALPLIRSLDVFSPGFCFALHVVNPSADDLSRLEQFARVLVSTRLAISIESTDSADATQDELRCYYACARFLILPDLLGEFGLPVLCVDADSLVVNPIDFRFSDDADADVVVFCEQLYDDVSAKRRVKNGTIVVQPNDRVQSLLGELRDEFVRVLSDEAVAWYVDQEVFARKLQEHQATIRLGHVREAYADWSFRGSSVIWAAKGDRKLEDVTYRSLMHMFADRRTEAMELVLPEPAAEVGRRARVAIYMPRLDLPWKLRPVEMPVARITGETLALRLQWKRFTVQLANALERQGVPVDVHEVPAVDITPEAIDAMGYRVAFVPHRCHLDFRAGTAKVYFYMQAYFRWVFVVDPRGWSAASSRYPFTLPDVDAVATGAETTGAFDAYRQKLGEGQLDSKFDQSQHETRASLIRSFQIPDKPYVFFPLQIPHDQSIRYFCDHSEEDVVDSVLAWSKRSHVPVVFKPHPVSQKLMRPFEERVKLAGGYWSTAHVQDLIHNSAAVYTLNSGVGFEALLQCKPVVTFGRTEYDCVTTHATPSAIGRAWVESQAATTEELEHRYRRFVDHFLGTYAVDMSVKRSAQARLDQIATAVAQELAA